MTVIMIVDTIGIAVTMASYVLPYSETTAVLCNGLHACSIESTWATGILFGIYAFCK